MEIKENLLISCNYYSLLYITMIKNTFYMIMVLTEHSPADT